MSRKSKNPSVLLVDPDPEAAGATSTALGSGYRIVTAVTGTAGVRALRKQRPTLAVLARTLPDRDGLDVLEEVVAAEPGIPVIVVLTAATSREAVEVFRRGAWDVAVKGGGYRDELCAAVERALSRVIPGRCGETPLVLRARELERRLEEAEGQRRMLEGVVEKSPAVTFVWENEPDLPVFFVTPNVTRLGFGSADFGPGRMVFADRIPQADLERFLLAAERAGQGGEEIVRHGLEGGDGRTRTVETRL